MLTINHYLQTLDLLYIDTNGLTVKSGQSIRLHSEQNDNHLETLYICHAMHWVMLEFVK